MSWVEFQVVKGWELGLAGSLCCRKPQDVSLAGGNSDEHTQNKADVQNNSMHEHAKYTLPTLTTFFFFSLSVAKTTLTLLWAFHHGSLSGRETAGERTIQVRG